MSTSIPMLMGDGLRRNAWKFPLKIAAKDKFRATTYGEFNRRVNQLANGLLAGGVRPGGGSACEGVARGGCARGRRGRSIRRQPRRVSGDLVRHGEDRRAGD